MNARTPFGLTGALLLLAACGPTQPTAEEGDDGAGETGSLCTLDNYAEDPERRSFTDFGCVPAEADGTCGACDVACMDAIVSCEMTYGFDECRDHTLLCSEQLGDQCCYLVTADYDGPVPGRPLRERGVPHLPTLTLTGSAATELTVSRAAASYREFARYERASVNAFLHAAAVLEELGAPRELLERHHDAAREEAEHSKLALAAAQALDGRWATLADPPEVAVAWDIQSFVRDLIHDGCVGEWIAAHEAAWALDQGCVGEHEALREYWAPVAVDEANHAELAWRTLEWLLAVHPELRPVVVEELAAATRSSARGQGSRPDQFGVPGSQTRAAVRERAVIELFSDARGLAAACA